MADIAWSEAPDGATHYNARNDLFYKVEDGEVFLDGGCGEYLVSALDADNLVGHPEVIPHPTKQEWDGGLPPVDVECEVMRESDKWEWCIPKAHRGSGSWITTKSEDIVIRNDLVRWRPLKSQHERQREELIAKADEVLSRAIEDDQPMAQALYDAGLLREGRVWKI